MEVKEEKEPKHHTWKCRCGALNREDNGNCLRCRSLGKDAVAYYD